MKTFSAMSVPDQQLTLLAYKQLISFLEMDMEPGMKTPMEIHKRHCRLILRLHQLIEALETELLSQ